MKDFRNIISDFPKQFKTGSEIAKDMKIDPPAGGFRNLIFCGMGGSIIPAEILFTLLPDLPNSFHIHRDFDLPAWTTKDDLVICISWSGGTAETISSYETARKLETKILVITKGGKLAELAENNGNHLIILPQEEIPARNGAGWVLTTLLTVLNNSDILTVTLDELVNLDSRLKPEKLEGRGRELANKINDKIPLIYASFQNRFLASFWKIKFNENAKVHAFFNHFPNLSHNEIAGFANPERGDSTSWNLRLKRFFVVLLKDSEDGKRQQKKTETAEKIISEKNIPYETVELAGKTRLEKIFNDYILSDWTSYHLARLRGFDPTEAETIERFKEMEL